MKYIELKFNEISRCRCFKITENYKILKCLFYLKYFMTVQYFMIFGN